MSSNDEIATLTASDYAVLAVLLGISAAVGFYFAYRDRKNKESENYHLGNRQIKWWASAISASLTFFSGSSIIGNPAEIMYRGSTYVWATLGIYMGLIVGCEVFIPIYYKNGMWSANEYLGIRFGKSAKIVAIVIYILQSIAFTGVMIYAPAIALNAVSDLSLLVSVLSVGGVCTIYTTLGGLKAVIWTDVVQGIILTIVLFIVLFVSANAVGGLSRCLEIAMEGDRLDFNHFELDPRYRMTFWSAAFGLGTMWISLVATNQGMVQRFLCCRSLKEGRMAIYGMIPISFIQVIFFTMFMGYVAYAYFENYDPLTTNEISAKDQVLPLMVLRVFSGVSGITGFFIAGVFAGALSTISSALNGMSSVTVGDIIRPMVSWSDSTILWISRGLTLLYGGLCIGFAFLAHTLGSIVQAAQSLLGLCAGALLGPMAMGVLFPWANEKGAVTGMITALSFNIWLFAGAWRYPPPVEFTNVKTFPNEECPAQILSNDTNFARSTVLFSSFVKDTTMSPLTVERPAIAEFYAVSFTYYSPLGLIVCMTVGLLVSVFTGGLQSRYQVNPSLIYLPFEHPWLRWFPKRFRQAMIPIMGLASENSDGDITMKHEAYESTSVKDMSGIENAVMTYL